MLSLKETYDASVTVWMPPDYRPQHAGIFDPAWKQVGFPAPRHSSCLRILLIARLCAPRGRALSAWR